MDKMTVQRNYKDLLKGYFWCPEYHERKSHKDI